MSAPHGHGRSQIDWAHYVSMAISFGLSIWSLNYMIAKMDPDRQSKQASKLQKKRLEQQLGRKISPLVGLEGEIASDLINPRNIDVTLEDIGGLDTESRTLAASIMLPLRYSHLFQSFLLHQPNGVLLYGPPGTGKTMLAKAIARESGASFISIRASSLQSKWFGQSQKMIRAVFSLAAKLTPAIIFLDEVDGILGTRKNQDHEVTTSMKTEFMQLWDGLESVRGAQILVLGATNRQTDLDPAVLRRFTLQIKVPMPDSIARLAILEKVLRRHAVSSEVDPGLLDVTGQAQRSLSMDNPGSASSHQSQLQEVAAATEGYSGADLMEMCSQAAVIPVQEFIEASTGAVATNGLSQGSASSRRAPSAPRALELRDLLKIVQRNKPSRADMAAGSISATQNDVMTAVLESIMREAGGDQPRSRE